ncbi:DUF6944 family repetitive protein [Sutcliffiella deserti]|uniref:DUF6944 family repetitive protein n=1 Tax=Sutcliffiella deserti TaxID=2875501 RepID=UPI001CBFE2CD|nr:hypothetical protein [Sutcliffiella deserti]
MVQQNKILLGSWTQALGTVLAALGSTPSFTKLKFLEENLSFIGNVLQATGNGLEAEGQEPYSYAKLGNEIQALGNITVIIGLIITKEEEQSLRLFISGNLLQALGAVISLGDLLEERFSMDSYVSFNGNMLQAIGNSLQAIGDRMKLEMVIGREDPLKSERADLIITKGSWIQAAGAIILAVAETKKQVKGRKES